MEHGHTHIFYFSSTGNSLKIGRSLAEKLGNTELFFIPSVMDGVPDMNADRIGLVFPMYYGGVPGIVKRFIGRFPAVQDKYVFAIASGRDENSPMGIFVSASELLRKRGVELSSGFYVRMVSNYIPMFDAASAGEQQCRFAEASERIDRIAGMIEQGECRIEKGSLLVNWLVNTIMNPLFSAGLHGADRRFRLNGKCNGCGTCAKVCPVANIELRKGVPTWLHHCEFCLACLQWCPESAIDYGKKTASRSRYRHPEARLKDFVNNP